MSYSLKLKCTKFDFGLLLRGMRRGKRGEGKGLRKGVKGGVWRGGVDIAWPDL